eukprot:jgi/Ulvmu1/8470/UM044_0003.1
MTRSRLRHVYSWPCSCSTTMMARCTRPLCTFRSTSFRSSSPTSHSRFPWPTSPPTFTFPRCAAPGPPHQPPARDHHTRTTTPAPCTGPPHQDHHTSPLHDSLCLRDLQKSMNIAAFPTAPAMLHLQAFSLAGETLPADTPPLRSLLCVLPALTSLDLSDSSLSSAAIYAVAGALPSFPQLLSLDLSNNRIHLLPLRALAGAVAHCTMLRTLRLLRTASSTTRWYPGCAAIARCLPRLPSLTAFAFSDMRSRYSPFVEAEAVEGLLRLLHALRDAPALRTLELRFWRPLVPPAKALPVIHAFSEMQQLQELRLQLPFIKYRSRDEGQETDVEVSNNAWCVAMSAISQLTALHVDTAHRAGFNEGIIANLTGMQHLRELWLRSLGACGNELPKLPQVLPSLAALTRLYVGIDPALGANRLCIVSDILPVLQSVPQLKALHLPVALQECSDERVNALRAATHLQLSLDLYLSPNVIDLDEDAIADCMLPCVPLFPYVRALYLELEEEGDHLPPVIDAAPSLSSLTSLHIHMWDPADPFDEAMLGFLSSLRHMSCLQRLTGTLYAFHDGNGDTAASILCDSISHLPGLTCMELHMEGRDWGKLRSCYHGWPSPMPLELLLTACSKLDTLRRLSLHIYPGNVLDECVRLFPQLSVDTLRVEVEEVDEVVSLRKMVMLMPHLRLLRVRTCHMQDCDVAAAEQAMRGLDEYFDRMSACQKVEFDPDIDDTLERLRRDQDRLKAASS